MAVWVQIPCLNEEDSLQGTLRSLACVKDQDCRVRLLVIDDGSTDRTVEVAEAAGVDRIVSHTRNRGLAAAFRTGLDECLRMGADIIVNTDGDGQYPASEIPRLIEPILAGRADLVIGDRRPSEDVRSSWWKRKLQKLGSKTVSWLAGQEIPDAVSGFRAMTRDAAIKMHVVTGFSYTIETVLQACSKGLAIEFVPITTNTVTRPSRLFRGIPQFVFRSGLTMLRVAFMFRPLAVLMAISGVLATVGVIPVVRFLIFWASGDGAGHIQSLVLGGVFLVLAGITAVAALLAVLMLSGCSSKPESRYDENIQCRSPNGMRDTKTLKRWKYDRIRETILQLLPEGEAGMAFPELLDKVTAEFSKEDQMLLGNVKWHIECTVLEMETAGEFTRFPDTPAPLPKNVKR